MHKPCGCGDTRCLACTDGRCGLCGTLAERGCVHISVRTGEYKVRYHNALAKVKRFMKTTMVTLPEGKPMPPAKPFSVANAIKKIIDGG